MGKTALLIGATGLVGNELMLQLLANEEYSKVKIFVRKKVSITNDKLEQIVVDFNDLQKYTNEIKGDVAFCCIGTTMKVAGSKDTFINVDYDIPINFAKILKANLVKKFIVVSSLGANKSSSNFYYSVKGKMENELKEFSFEQLVIVRPSMLLGNRKEFRLGELIGKKVMKFLSFLFIGNLKKYKAIEAKCVAKAMIAMAASSEKFLIIESDRLQQIGK